MVEVRRDMLALWRDHLRSIRLDKMPASDYMASTTCRQDSVPLYHPAFPLVTALAQAEAELVRCPAAVATPQETRRRLWKR